MRIVVSAQGDTLDAPASPVFGRCPTYVFVDTDTMEFEAVPNPAMNQGEGAGIQAAQFVVGQGAQAVLSGNLGPNALAVLLAAGVSGYLVPEGSVRQAVEAFKDGKLCRLGEANVAAHAGVAGGAVWSAGPGRGRGMGRGRGRGCGMGGGFQPATPSPAEPEVGSESEVAQLRETIESLRQQLARATERLDTLEKKG